MKILTHAGTHHADEVLAIATIFELLGECEVIRTYDQEIIAAAQQDPDIWVLDIGRKYDDRNNYDHHQDANTAATNLLAALEEFSAGISKGAHDVAQIWERFEEFRAAQTDLIKMIGAAYTVADLKKKIHTRPGARKADLVENYYLALMSRFSVKDGLVSYSMEKTYLEAIRDLVAAQTADDLAAHVERVAARSAEWKASLTDPQTLEQFRKYIRFRGADALTDEQRRRFEELVADNTFRKIREADERRATVTAVHGVDDVEFDIVETVHTKKGYPLWVVTTDRRVDRDKYRELVGKAKNLGGWYSSYSRDGAVPGYQFKARENAEQFIGLARGENARQLFSSTRKPE